MAVANVDLSGMDWKAVAVVALFSAGVVWAAKRAGEAALDGLTGGIDDAIETVKINRETAEQDAQNRETSVEIHGRLREISARTGLNIDSMDELNRLESSGLIYYDDKTSQWERMQ